MEGGRPYWETKYAPEDWPFFEDFRNALTEIWEFLGLPTPTEAQYEIACRLQYGVDSVEWNILSPADIARIKHEPRYDIIRSYRAIGKSYITAAFAAWKLARNPRDEKILVVSATGNKSKEFVSQLKGVLHMPKLEWLLNGKREGGMDCRDQADKFDVSLASMSQVYSVRAGAILGQIVGARATTIIADDVEINLNSATEEAREKLINACREFGPISKTEHGRGDVFYLGTPQTEESIYNVLVKEHNATTFTIPVRFPEKDKMENYQLKLADSEEHIDILAYYLRDKFKRKAINHGDMTDPERFTFDELIKEEAKGRAYFALQMMLDTSLSDAEKYPLKQQDLILFSVNNQMAPLTVAWGHDTDRKNYINDIANVGFSGDRFLRPLRVDNDWSDYDGSVLFVDPAGRGKDETAWAIIKSLNGVLYLQHVGGHVSDPEQAMIMIATDAKKYNVNIVEVEPNFGQGMWKAAFEPILQQIWPGGCSIQESEWAKGQKETRIIDTLEPVMTTHRLVFDENLVRQDVVKRDSELVYSLMYQLTHITRDRNSLKHDDRIDAVAGAVAHFQRTVSQDIDEAAEAIRRQRMDEEIEAFVEMHEAGPLSMRRRTERLRKVRGKRKADGERTEVLMMNW